MEPRCSREINRGLTRREYTWHCNTQLSRIAQLVRTMAGVRSCTTISAGDVLVSRSSARADLYEISVVPALASMKCTRYGEGMDAGRQLACRLGVGAWFTCDHTHFLHLDGQ